MTRGTSTIALQSQKAGDRTAWVHLIPAGRFDGVDGRGPYRLSDAATVIETTRQRNGKRQIPIDYEHQTIHTETNGRPAPAAGWIVGMESRDDGVWGLVEWTETAAAHITKREYRYISPVFSHDKAGTVQALVNAALTNTPNLDQLVALNRAEAPPMNEELNAALRQAATLLGLPAGTGLDGILPMLKELAKLASDIAALTGDESLSANAAAPDPARYVPIGEYTRAVKEANALRQGITDDAASAHVAEQIKAGRLMPAMRNWAISLCKVNKPAFDSFMAETGPAFNAIVAHSSARASLPRGNAAAGGTADLSSDELAICKVMGVTPEEFTKARG